MSLPRCQGAGYQPIERVVPENLRQISICDRVRPQGRAEITPDSPTSSRKLYGSTADPFAKVDPA
jgi:hypothetical protein